MPDINSLSDNELGARLLTLRGQERSVLVEVLQFLAEVEQRKLHLL